jgi:imidazolonepropionase
MAELFFHNARVYPKADGDEVVDCFAVEQGRIVSLGEPVAAAQHRSRRAVVLPGFIDCHTHLLWAGDRADEFALRQAGAGYAEIARAGGGILSTVRAVRGADEDTLVALALPRLAALQAEGVTCVEIKSGYGLDLDTELKMLRAIRRLGTLQPLRVRIHLSSARTPCRRIAPRRLPRGSRHAHAARDRRGAPRRPWISTSRTSRSRSPTWSACSPPPARWASACAPTPASWDGRRHGRGRRLGALSCDHLEYADAEAVAAMARHGTVAVLLPGAWYCLRETRCRRSACCAPTACRWRWRATPIPAPRRS